MAGNESLHCRAAEDAGSRSGVEHPDLPRLCRDASRHELGDRRRREEKAMVPALPIRPLCSIPFTDTVGVDDRPLPRQWNRHVAARCRELRSRASVRHPVQDRHLKLMPACHPPAWACGQENRTRRPSCRDTAMGRSLNPGHPKFPAMPIPYWPRPYASGAYAPSSGYWPVSSAGMVKIWPG